MHAMAKVAQQPFLQLTSDMDSPVAANVFGTLGAVLWSLQVIMLCTTICSRTASVNTQQALTADLDKLAPT